MKKRSPRKGRLEKVARLIIKYLNCPNTQADGDSACGNSHSGVVNACLLGKGYCAEDCESARIQISRGDLTYSACPMFDLPESDMDM